jgi:hypothetical protein
MVRPGGHIHALDCERAHSSPRAERPTRVDCGWHHDYVKRILTCEKYIGHWVSGKRRNRRNQLTGKTKQVPTPEESWTSVTVEQLRIVPQDLWEAALHCGFTTALHAYEIAKARLPG